MSKITAIFRGGSTASVINAYWVPMCSAMLIELLGAIGMWMQQPWLFAAIAPTALMVAANSGHETTNFRAIVVGHLAAIACAYVALLMFNATSAEAMLAPRVVPFPRIWASAVALALLAIVMPRLRAYHPPAAATALLVTLGAYRMTGKTPLALMGGAVVMGLAAEALVRFRRRRGR